MKNGKDTGKRHPPSATEWLSVQGQGLGPYCGDNSKIGAGAVVLGGPAQLHCSRCTGRIVRKDNVLNSR